MILLTSTSDKLQVITASAVVTMHMHASYVDVSGATVTPGRTNLAIATAATSDLVPAPAVSTQRTVKTVTIRNSHATSSNLVTVQHTDGTTVPTLQAYTLLAQEQLHYNEGDGWAVIDAGGGKKTSPAVGRLVKTTTLTAGTSFTTGPSTTSIRIRMVGGGGGGGGCTSVASAASAGGGGGSGGYAEKLFTVTPNTAYAYTIGALGAGASGALGGNGTASTFVVGGVTVTANGGTGGPVATAVTTLVAYAGGAGGVVSTNGDLNGAGDPGKSGIVLITATPIVSSGAGGSSPLGSGGVGIVAVGNGNAAAGFGSGGSGAATGASVVRTGGSGTAGAIVVDEYS